MFLEESFRYNPPAWVCLTVFTKGGAFMLSTGVATSHISNSCNGRYTIVNLLSLNLITSNAFGKDQYKQKAFFLVRSYM